MREEMKQKEAIKEAEAKRRGNMFVEIVNPARTHHNPAILQRRQRTLKHALLSKLRSKLTRKRVPKKLHARKPCARAGRYKMHLRLLRPPLLPAPLPPVASLARTTLKLGYRSVLLAVDSHTQPRSPAMPVSRWLVYL